MKTLLSMLMGPTHSASRNRISIIEHVNKDPELQISGHFSTPKTLISSFHFLAQRTPPARELTAPIILELFLKNDIS
jgi:hypothetical protein